MVIDSDSADHSHATEIPGRIFWKNAKRVSFFAPFLLAGLFYTFFGNQISVADGKTFGKLMFALSTCAVALIVAGTYFYAYRFFEENFYFFIFVSWIANAVYLIPDLVAPSIYDSDFPTYKICVFFLSLTSTAFLVLALLSRASKGSSEPTWRQIPKSTWITVIAAGIAYVVIAYVCINYVRINFPRSEESIVNLARWMVPGSALSFMLLWAVGSAIKIRLSNENPGWKIFFLRDTFWAYAVLQFSYPFTLFITLRDLNQLQDKDLVLPLFLIAQVAKVGNALSMMGVLQSTIAHRDSNRTEKIRNAENEMRIKEAELEAQEAELRRERQFVELGMLASSIKHDVNTPLATMSFQIETLKDRFQHDGRITRTLENLEESMARIYATVKVVDIFRGDKSYFDRDRFMSKTSMLEVVHRAVRSVKNEKGELKLNDPRERIKVTGRDVWVRANSPMLEQVIVNVIKNGLEAIEEAERESGLISITVGTTELPESEYSRWVKVDVVDNGCGIPLENMDKLMSLFTTRSDKKPNSGIGLFIGKKILDIHDGEIKFESEVAEGTRVTILLPEWNALQKQKAIHESGEGGSRTKGQFSKAGPSVNEISEAETRQSESSTPEKSGE